MKSLGTNQTVSQLRECSTCGNTEFVLQLERTIWVVGHKAALRSVLVG